jgi:HEAT repeat protein
MNKLLLLIAFAGMSVHAADFDVLLFDATRYGSTPEKREAKRVAREELKTRMPDALRAAMEWIHGDHVGLQVLVMEWVLELPSETVVPVLADYIDHPREETRRVAIFFLGFHQAPELADRVMPFLDDEKCRGAAARTLGKWKIASARPALENMLVEGNERQRVVAANALRDLGDAAALPALIAALNDPVFTVRHTAARAVVVLGETAPPLLGEETATSDSVNRLRQRILADLNKLTPAEALGEPAIALDGAFFLP